MDTSSLPGVSLEDVTALVNTCGKSWQGLRDRASILALLDTGARAAEFLALNVPDMNMRTGEVYIADGKGGKPRTVFTGRAARRYLRRYLRTRNDGSLWLKQDGERLIYSGRRGVLGELLLIAERGKEALELWQQAPVQWIKQGCKNDSNKSITLKSGICAKLLCLNNRSSREGRKYLFIWNPCETKA